MSDLLSKSLPNTYGLLFEHFGPQGWWPTTPRGELRPRYYPEAFRDHLLPEEQWEIVVGAFLTQNTAWRNVELALGNLSAGGLLNLRGMHDLEWDELAALIRPSGFFNQKSSRLKQLASHIVDRYDGRIDALLSRPLIGLRRELLSTPGIGPETADSILLYAARYPFFVVDAYTRRIFGRLGLFDPDLNYAAIQSIFMDHLPQEVQLFDEYHALLVRLAVTYCKTRPQCENCCLQELCEYRNHL
ncbi:MAG: endonuclease III domain-containing protein [Gemmatimonadetes bacterium]|jgi:endonuclease III related protein|nr:endonuclease III domain-containing protein [Gemmatimonadota bacterium]